MGPHENAPGQRRHTDGRFAEAGPGTAPDPFIRDYLERIEDAFTPDDRARIEAYLLPIIRGNGEGAPSMDAIAESIFFSEHDPRLVAIAERLRAEGRGSLRDYLLTKAETRLGRIIALHAAAHPSSGTRRKRSEAPRSPTAPTEGRRPPHPDRDEQARLESDESMTRPVSEMNLESLLSRRTIGRIDPPAYCQASYAFSIPYPQGMRRPRQKRADDRSARHTEPLDDDQIGPGDLLIELPGSRIMDRVLPVPSGYMVVGSPDRALALHDPDDENPFCTRLEEPFDDEPIRYVVRRDTLRSFDPARHAPNDRERAVLGACLPVPDQIAWRAPEGVAAAAEAVKQHLRERYVYCCDDRLGAFIAKRANSLGTIMEGLGLGHCDLLAWTAAAYLRALGFTAFVAHTEISSPNGRAFRRDTTHSRVMALKENGLPLVFDPAAICAKIEGYALGAVDDGAFATLAREFDAASTDHDRLRVLHAFRIRVEENHAFVQPTKDDANRLDSTEAQAATFPGTNFTDDDVDAYGRSVSQFAPHLPGTGQRAELNRILDIYGKMGMPLDRDMASKYLAMRQIEMDAQTASPPEDPNWGYLGVLALARGKLARALCPSFLEFVYGSLADGIGHLPTDDTMVFEPNIPSQALATLPPKDRLASFRPPFIPIDLPKTPFELPTATIIENFAFMQLQALALVDEDAAAYLRRRFGVGPEALDAFARDIEPALRPDVKRKKTVATERAFSGKPAAAEHEALLRRSAALAREFRCVASERAQARSRLIALLSSLRLRPEPGARRDWNAERDRFDAVEADYQPETHTLAMVDQSASARRGRTTVLAERWNPRQKKKLHIHIDADSGEGSCSLSDHYARVFVLMETLIAFSRSAEQALYISSNNNDYLLVSPGLRPSIDALVFRLVTQRADRTDHGTHGLSAEAGLPTNLLYLSASQGRVNAVKRMLGRRTNVLAKTFSDLGMDIFPRLRIPENAHAEE